MHTTIAPDHQTFHYIESNISTINTIYFLSLNSTLAEMSCSENNGESIITGDTTVPNDDSENYQWQSTSLHKTTYYNPAYPTSQTGKFSGQDHMERPDIQPATKIPLRPPPSNELYVNSEDKENISEMACHLKDKLPIWGLICDLSKTSRSTRKYE